MDQTIKLTIMRDDLDDNNNLYPTSENIKRGLLNLCKQVFSLYNNY